MIGYYVHHHGRGHLERARSIATQLRTQVTGLSSLPRPADWPGEWVELDWDLADQGQVDEPTADGALHWAPLEHPGLRARMAGIAVWIEEAAPSALVSDVSVEVAILARLMGIPLISVALPGLRDDAPHVLGYRLSSAIVGLWPAGLTPSGWSPRWREKTHPVGAFSRFDQREQVDRARGTGERSVLVLLGAGGDQITKADLDAAATATPGWNWRAFGPGHWVEDPWTDLCRADVVVTHAGQNCLAEVAAARRAAIVIPQPRPYDEQLVTARTLEREHLAIVSYSWPRPGAWPGLLGAAHVLGGARWNIWSDGDGARRAAQAIEDVAARVEARTGAIPSAV